MRRKVTNEKPKDSLNPNFNNHDQIRIKPPIPTVFPSVSRLPSKLKDKVTNLVQMQLKHHQSNQNYLIQDSGLQSHTNYENEKNISIYINTKYDIVEKVAMQLQFKVVKECEEWNISWIDGSINSAKAFNLKRNQRVNHFPGMNEISRKDKLQKNLKIMQRYFPLDYNIFPRTWSLPAEKNDIINFIRDQNNEETFIIKPACSSQGRGIILIKDIKSLSFVGNTICQSYIANPFLIDNFKFDLRIYVLITSCDPFRIYIYEEGLARFATHKYEKPNKENLNNIYMHLTNYSVQRNSSKYDLNEISGTKRRSSTIYEWFKEHGYDADAIWKSIDDVIIKTMLCANNSIQHHYCATFPDQYRTSACFELLGFDVILDDKLKPFILEVNHSPSLETETNIDVVIKSQLLRDVFNLVNSVPTFIKNISDVERIRSAERLYWSRNKYMSSRKSSFEFRKILQDIQNDLAKNELDNRNGFRLLYPILNQTEKYQRFFEFNCDNHRKTFNRCPSLDESEHKKILDISKDVLVGVLNVNRSCKLNVIHESPTKPFKTVFQNTQPISRDSNIIKQFYCNVNLGSRQKDFLNGNKNSSLLLNTSTKSLKRILSCKKYTEISKSINEKKVSSDSKGLSKKSSGSCSRSNSAKTSQISEIDVKVDKFQNNTKNIKEVIMHKVDETCLNQPSAAGLEWESSLSSNKIQYVSQFNFEVQKKASSTSKTYLKMFQNSAESAILDQNHPLSDNLITPYHGLSSSKSLDDISIPLINISENLRQANKTARISANRINKIQNNYVFETNLQTTLLNADSVMDTSINERESENLYSTHMNLNSLETNNLNELDADSFPIEPFCKNEKANKISHKSDISEKFSDEFSYESFSVSDIQYSKSVFTAEIQDHPGLSNDKTPNDTLKNINNSSSQICAIGYKTLEKVFNIAEVNNIKNSIYCSETKPNKKFNQDSLFKRFTRNKILSRNQIACKRKYLNTPVTYNQEPSETYLNREEIMEYVQSINLDTKIEPHRNLNSNQIVEVDPEVSIIEEINSPEKVKLDNKSVTFNTDILTIKTKNNRFDDYHCYSSGNNSNEANYSDTKYEFKQFQYFNDNKYGTPQKDFLKNHKPIIKHPKITHQRILTYNIDPKFTSDRIAANLNPNVRDCMNKIKLDAILQESETFIDEYNMEKTNSNANNNVCEINITPSTVTENSTNFKDDFNFTISINSNLENSVSCTRKGYRLADANYDEINSDSLNSDFMSQLALTRNRNSNHLVRIKSHSKAPVVIKCFRHSMKKFDHYVDLCIGNHSDGYIQKPEKFEIKQLTPDSNITKWYPNQQKPHSKNVMFRLPELTFRGLNNIIHLLPHRKHKNKSFNLDSFQGHKLPSRLPTDPFEPTRKLLSTMESFDKTKPQSGLNIFRNSDTIRKSKSMLCSYLKNIGHKSKFSRPSKLSSTKRLCKILTDKTNSKNKSKDDNFTECQKNSKFQY